MIDMECPLSEATRIWWGRRSMSAYGAEAGVRLSSGNFERNTLGSGLTSRYRQVAEVRPDRPSKPGLVTDNKMQKKVI